MNDEKIIDGIRKCMKVVLDLDESEAMKIQRESIATDFINWNSMNHVKLIFELENYFDVSFDPFAVAEMISINMIIEALQDNLK